MATVATTTEWVFTELEDDGSWVQETAELLRLRRRRRTAIRQEFPPSLFTPSVHIAWHSTSYPLFSARELFSSPFLSFSFLLPVLSRVNDTIEMLQLRGIDTQTHTQKKDIASLIFLVSFQLPPHDCCPIAIPQGNKKLHNMYNTRSGIAIQVQLSSS